MCHPLEWSVHRGNRTTPPSAPRLFSVAAAQADKRETRIVSVVSSVPHGVPDTPKHCPCLRVEAECIDTSRNRSRRLRTRATQCGTGSFRCMTYVIFEHQCFANEKMTLVWPDVHVRLSVPLCDSNTLSPIAAHRAAKDVHRVHACAPAYASRTAAAARATLRMTARWATLAAEHCGQLHLHAQNRGDEFEAALRRATPELLRTRRLLVYKWNWIEAMESTLGSRMSSDAHNLLHGTKTKDINPKHTTLWTWTKCAVEQRTRTRWMMMMDIDEFFALASDVRRLTTLAPPAPRGALSAALDAVPSNRMQYNFCQPTPPRPKSALRIDSRCAWWGYFHFGFSVFPDPACNLFDRSHSRRILHWGRGGIWNYFDRGAGCNLSQTSLVVEHTSLRAFIRQTEEGNR